MVHTPAILVLWKQTFFAPDKLKCIICVKPPVNKVYIHGNIEFIQSYLRLVAPVGVDLPRLVLLQIVSISPQSAAIPNSITQPRASLGITLYVIIMVTGKLVTRAFEFSYFEQGSICALLATSWDQRRSLLWWYTREEHFKNEIVEAAVAEWLTLIQGGHGPRDTIGQNAHLRHCCASP